MLKKLEKLSSKNKMKQAEDLRVKTVDIKLLTFSK